jgi:hypothetical protein
MMRARSRTAAVQFAAKLGERGTVELIGNEGRCVTLGEQDAIRPGRPDIDVSHGGDRKGRTRTMLGADIA